ncbi:MAG TPA: shikimate dehydrogenase [Fimbriimonas sp.]
MNRVFHWREAPPADYAVIGDPVAHSLSPKMHQAAYEALRLPFRYVAIHVPRGEARQALDALASLRYRGVNATVPHKEDAARWATKRDNLTDRLNAANTIRFRDRSCINTDITGFWDTLAGLRLPNSKALILGAGGSARAVVLSLAMHGFEVAIWNRTKANATQLLSTLGVRGEVLDQPVLEDAGLVVNTTSASLQGEDLAVRWERLHPDALAYDLMYSRGPTPFLASAAAHGRKAMDGRRLLAAQGARSLEYWLDMRAPRDVMLEALTEEGS